MTQRNILPGRLAALNERNRLSKLLNKKMEAYDVGMDDDMFEDREQEESGEEIRSNKNAMQKRMERMAWSIFNNPNDVNNFMAGVNPLKYHLYLPLSGDLISRFRGTFSSPALVNSAAIKLINTTYSRKEKRDGSIFVTSPEAHTPSKELFTTPAPKKAKKQSTLDGLLVGYDKKKDLWTCPDCNSQITDNKQSKKQHNKSDKHQRAVDGRKKASAKKSTEKASLKIVPNELYSEYREELFNEDTVPY